jgi:predicted DCC family thiol-disulfide oxidoreductase YuxK
MQTHKHAPNEPIVFFDDLCVLCSGSVLLLIRLDRKKKLKFSSLQGRLSQTIEALQPYKSMQSVVFLNEQGAHTRTEAVIQILKQLGGLYWFLGQLLSVFPTSFLNIFYDFIARNRYRIFGKNEVCMVPSAEVRDRFIP